MKKLSCFFALIFTLLSCEFKDIEFLGLENVKLDKMDGQELNLDLLFKIKNENAFKIKVKPSKLKVFVEDKEMGIVHLDKKIVFKKRSESVYSTKLRVDLADGYLLKLLSFASKKEFKIRFEGKVKGGIYFLSKKFEINETRTFSREQLKIDQLMRGDASQF